MARTQALYTEIERQVRELSEANLPPAEAAPVLRDLAAAFQHVVGGPRT